MAPNSMIGAAHTKGSRARANGAKQPKKSAGPAGWKAPKVQAPGLAAGQQDSGV